MGDTKDYFKNYDIESYTYSMQKAGFTEEQAKIQAEAIAKIIHGKMTTKQLNKLFFMLCSHVLKFL